MITAANAVITLEYAKHEKKFTEWEDLFARNIVKIAKANPNKALTTKQEAIVLRIYAAKTGAGEKEFHKYIG
jgi:hypothetical protein